MMVVHDNELNLSLQEYQYYQECPQKFRLYRILNPLPDKEIFMSKKRSINEYGLRNYSEDEINGLKYHQFFSSFHLNYEYSIKKNSITSELISDTVKSLFWKYQLQRYKKSLENYPWRPLVTEFNIMNKSQRGIIDCVEFTNNDEELRIIDYKKSKHKGNLESLYFYAILLDDYMKEKNWDGLKIKEVGCYYYIEGEFCIFEYKYKKREYLLEKINSILETIKEEYFNLQRNSCNNCNLKIICDVENARY